MARTWNDALYGPPPRRNARKVSASPPEEEYEYESEPEEEQEEPELRGSDSESDSGSEGEAQKPEEKPHRCFNLWCNCLEKARLAAALAKQEAKKKEQTPPKKPRPNVTRKRNLRKTAQRNEV